MKVSPYYSLTRGIAVEELWHDNDECEIGLSIAVADRLPGKPRTCKYCPYCQLHNAPRQPKVLLK